MVVMKRALAIGLTAMILAPATAHAWTKTYVVDWFEPAYYFGGAKGGGSEAPGADCPNGLSNMDWKTAIITPYRTAAQAEAINNPELWRGFFLSHIGFRGKNRENIYENPTSVPDPGLTVVGGKIAEGFDLDDNPDTGFTSPDGQRGIDNVLYKIHGCLSYYRGAARDAAATKTSNESMRDGKYSVVVVFEGQGDPMNDDDVTVGVYGSKDKIVKDANGGVALDYTFFIDPDPNVSSVFKGKITNGVFETKAPVTFVSYDTQLFYVSPLKLEKARARFVFQKNGTVDGLVGGYRDFFEQYRLLAGNGETWRGAIRENLGRFSMAGVYYAMRREADGLPDPVTGRNRGISSVYTYRLTPAFVVAPNLKIAISTLEASRPPAPNNPLRLNDNTEEGRLATASFEPIAAVAQAGRVVRRVTYRDPFAQPFMPNIILEKKGDDYTFTVTAMSGKIRHEGKISEAEWNSVVVLDPALKPRKAAVTKARTEICHSKQMVIEATDKGKTLRREASVCGGDADNAAVLYSYRVAEIAVRHIGACAGFIESGREFSWSLGECFRPLNGPPGPLSGGSYGPALGAN